MENSRTCDICNIDVHRTCYKKHLRSEKHLENGKQNEMIIAEWLYKSEQTPIEKKIQNVYNPKTLKQIAKENNILIDEELDKESTK